MPFTASDEDNDQRTSVRRSVRRSVGPIDEKVAPPSNGFLLSQSFAHCDLCVCTASSSARL